MKLVDIVDLAGERLHDPAWVGRLRLPRGCGCFCLLLCDGIAGDVACQGETLALSGPAAIVLPPGGGITLSVCKDAHPSSFAGAVFFEVSPLDPLYTVAKRLATRRGQDPPDGARGFFSDLARQFSSGSVFRLQAARHQTAAFLYSLAEESVAASHEDRGHIRIEQALELMHANSAGAMSLGDICSALRLSEAYFIRLFKRVMHVTPMKYFMRLKHHTASLLLMQGWNIKEVADHLGFSSESHFSKQFKRHMGVPPKNYKRNYVEVFKSRLGEPDKSIMLVSAVLSRYVDSVADMIFVKDASFVYRGCNTAFCQYVGKGKKDIFGHTDFTLFPHETAAFYRERDERIFASRRSIKNKEVVVYPDGSRKLVEASKSPYFGLDGELLGMIGISRVISDEDILLTPDAGREFPA